MSDRISADELECRARELEAAQARHWAAIDNPQTAKDDLALTSRLLDYAETCMREAITSPITAEAEAEALRDGPEIEAEPDL